VSQLASVRNSAVLDHVCSAPHQDWRPQLGTLKASKTGGNRETKPPVDRLSKQQWHIVQEGIKSWIVSEPNRVVAGGKPEGGARVPLSRQASIASVIHKQCSAATSRRNRLGNLPATDKFKIKFPGQKN